MTKAELEQALRAVPKRHAASCHLGGRPFLSGRQCCIPDNDYPALADAAWALWEKARDRLMRDRVDVADVFVIEQERDALRAEVERLVRDSGTALTMIRSYKEDRARLEIEVERMIRADAQRP